MDLNHRPLSPSGKALWTLSYTRIWLREQDLHLRPPPYEDGEIATSPSRNSKSNIQPLRSAEPYTLTFSPGFDRVFRTRYQQRVGIEQHSSCAERCQELFLIATKSIEFAVFDRLRIQRIVRTFWALPSACDLGFPFFHVAGFPHRVVLNGAILLDAGDCVVAVCYSSFDLPPALRAVHQR